MEKKETTRSPLHWKRKAAMAIGRPDLINSTDEELEKAHDEHMRIAYLLAQTPEEEGDPGSTIRDDMPPGPASVANEQPVAFTNEGIAITNEKQRSVFVESLMNEAVHRQGITRDQARSQLRTLRPELFPKPVVKGPSAEQVRARDERSNQVQSLVNEKMAGSSMSYDAAFNLVRNENPHLFPARRR